MWTVYKFMFCSFGKIKEDVVGYYKDKETAQKIAEDVRATSNYSTRVIYENRKIFS